MFLIVGLGNPTEKYAGTRHNVGFAVIDSLAEQYKIPVQTRKHKALLGLGILGGERVLLAKPQTYMNNSGECVRALLDFYRSDPEKELLVIYDDIHLSLGQIRIRTKGSAGGHNGLKSILAHVGQDAFLRIRVGVGEKPPFLDLADYVLGHFQPQEHTYIRQGIEQALCATETILHQGVEQAMNQYNRKEKSRERVL